MSECTDTAAYDGSCDAECIVRYYGCLIRLKSGVSHGIKTLRKYSRCECDKGLDSHRYQVHCNQWNRTYTYNITTDLLYFLFHIWHARNYACYHSLLFYFICTKKLLFKMRNKFKFHWYYGKIPPL